MTPDQLFQWAQFGGLGLFSGACLYLYWQEVQAHKNTKEQLVALIARYDSTVGKVTDGLVEAAEAMTATRVDNAWERDHTERRKR